MPRKEVKTATRYRRRKRSVAIAKSLLKTLAEPITNSDDSYNVLSAQGAMPTDKSFPITIYVDRKKRQIKVVDNAEGMTAKELENKFEEYGAAKSGAYEGYGTRGLFGQGVSDVLFYHEDGVIRSVKNGHASICKFTEKSEKSYIEVEDCEVNDSSLKKLSKEWKIDGDRGTVVEFRVAEDTPIHDYENLVKRLSSFYMLRLINSNDLRDVQLVYKDTKETKRSRIRYNFPKGEPVDNKSFELKFENYDPVKIDVELYRSKSPLPTSGDERESGILVHDEEGAVYDLTLFGLDSMPHTDRFFGFMKLTGAREIILDKLNDKKHPEEILSDSRDGLNVQHEFYKELELIARDWLQPILAAEKKESSNKNVSEATVESHRKALEELNKLDEELTGEDDGGTIRKRKKVKLTGGMEFARNRITVTAGKKYGLQLLIDATHKTTAAKNKK